MSDQPARCLRISSPPNTLPRVLLCAALGAIALVAPRLASASCVPGFDYGAFGKYSVDFGGDSSLDSFNSAAGNYAATQANTGGDIGTNGTSSGSIVVHGTAASVYGNLYYGVGGTSGAVTIHGNPSYGTIGGLTTNLSLASVVVPDLGASKGALSGGTMAPGSAYTTVSGNVSVGAGTYVVATLSASLTVTSGPVIIYVTTAFSATVTNNLPSNPGTPGNLVFMIGSAVSSLELPGGSYALYAPDTDLSLHGNDDVYGAVVGRTITITGTPNFHYDKALSSITVGSFDCSPIEISRAAPVIATISNQSSVVQGTFIPASSAATAITDIASIAKFTFPPTQGHMRARVTSTITSSASKFSSGTIVFDAGAVGKIPSVNFTGCSTMTGSCRNVFTITSTPGTSGVQFHPSTVQLKDGNASAIGPLIAPTSIISGIGATQWQTIVRTVLSGVLGGIDRSTVAVISPSSFAGSATRPTMAYFGASDGMLHAVCASTGGTTASASSICPSLGTELWAFLPRVQLPLIRTNTTRIDGSPRVVDVFGDFTTSSATGTRSWHTILTFQTGFAVGATPAAYAIDITDPASPTVLWEYSTPSSPTSLDFGTGLTVAAGPTMSNGQLTNLAILQTSNGGSGGVGVVTTAVSAETGSAIWQFGYAYPSPPRGVAADTAFLPTTGIAGGAVGVDLAGNGYMTDVVFGDLYGDLWRLNAADGTSRNGATTPLFSFSTNKHPFGAPPAIYSAGGQQYALIASGGYADPTATSWTTSTQYLIAAKLSSTATTISETTTACLGCALAINTTLTSGEKAFSQALIVGNQAFVTTDSSDVSLSSYGTSSTTAHVTSVSLTSTTSPTTVVVSAGASSLVNTGTTLFNSSSTEQQLVSVSATSTAGTSVDSITTPKLSRMLWLSTL
jgi:hypothetical protein